MKRPKGDRRGTEGPAMPVVGSHLQQPCSWVVGFIRNDEPAFAGQHRDVAPERIGRVQAGHVRRAEDIFHRGRSGPTRRAAEHDEIVTLGGGGCLSEFLVFHWSKVLLSNLTWRWNG